jgi:hypothetical protein
MGADDTINFYLESHISLDDRIILRSEDRRLIQLDTHDPFGETNFL